MNMSSSPFIRFGTAWYPDHWPEEEWARDLDLIRASGIDCIRFGEFSWSWFEPRPGEFRWDAYERFVELAQQRSLSLILCTPTATPPPWFLRKFPDSRLVDADGIPCRAHRHFICWDHPGARAEAERTVRALVRHFRGHPAIAGWQVDNEPNYSESMTIYDFNPHALRSYRNWLRHRYQGDLAALNRAWYANFWSQAVTDWEEIGELAPQRSNPNAWLDFARYRDWAVADMVQAQAKWIREEWPQTHVGTNIPETGIKFSLTIAQDYWAQARGMDWIGTDLYFASGDRAADRRGMRFCSDLMRSVSDDSGAEFYISETQGGPHQRTWPQAFAGEIWGADYLRQSVETYAEHGARQIWFFLFRPTPAGAEMGMNGLCDADGGASERTREVLRMSGPAEQGRFVKRFNLRERRPLALMHYPRDTVRFNGYWISNLDNLQKSMLGWHQMLCEAGWRIRFIDDDGLAAGHAEGASLLALPQSQLLDDAQIGAINDLADAGLPILLGPHCALLDRYGHLRQKTPGGVLAARAGIRPGLWRDQKADAERLFGISVAVDGRRDFNGAAAGTVLLRFRKSKVPAVVRSGGLTWCAFDPGLAYDKAASAARKKLVRLLLPKTTNTKV